MNEDSQRNRQSQTPRVLECCGGINNVDYSQMDLAPLQSLFKLIDFTEPTFCVAVAAIIFNPLFWNVLCYWLTLSSDSSDIVAHHPIRTDFSNHRENDLCSPSPQEPSTREARLKCIS